jgi:hypothetical protein
MTYRVFPRPLTPWARERSVAPGVVVWRAEGGMRRGVRISAVVAALAVSSGAVVSSSSAGDAPQAATIRPARAGVSSAPFVPPPGRTLLIVGQDLGAVAGYAAHVHPTPGGVTTYTDIFTLDGLRQAANWGAGDVDARACLERYPNSTLAIGLFMVERSGGELDRLLDGAFDRQIDDLGRFIGGAARPVYLRIGYEFDGPWNHYAPPKYVAAYRRIVDRLRAAGTVNFATVWHSAAGESFEGRAFDDWWPGDAYVDWIGTSFFRVDVTLRRHAQLIEWARRKGKPLMICEASPQGYNVDEGQDGPPPVRFPDRGLSFSSDGTAFTPRTSRQIWDEWYAPFFRLVHENADVIRAVAYINVEWNAQRVWGSGTDGYWGDSRIEANRFIEQQWRAEIAKASWLHGGPGLFDALRRR